MNSENIKKSVYTVNMHCEGCADTIKKGLSGIEGVILVDPILEKKKVSVKYDRGRVSSEEIKERIRNLGGVSPKALTDSLNLLLSKGFIDKRRIKGIPPRVEYTLTERGKEIVSLLRPLIIWAVDSTGHRECQIVGHFL